MWNENGQNQMLDATDAAYLSSHTDYPGETGANEQTGALYARVPVAFGAATGRTLTISGTPTVTVEDYDDHAWWGFWDAASAGNCRAILPNDGEEKEYCIDLATGTFSTKAAHGYAEDTPIVFFPNAPGGLTAGVIYYAVNVTTYTFEVSDAPSDYALSPSSQPSDPSVVSKITVDDGSNGDRDISLGPNATLHNGF